jgi:transposase-like protein
MARRKRRKFTAQFKADAVRLVTTGAKTIAAVTEEFDLTETALRAWVKRAEADEGKGKGKGKGETLTTAERSELIDLRKRLKRAEMERDILKKATAFFAKENA